MKQRYKRKTTTRVGAEEGEAVRGEQLVTQRMGGIKYIDSIEVSMPRVADSPGETH